MSPSVSLQSSSMIVSSEPDADVIKDTSTEVFGVGAFREPVIYRRFYLDTDNITGSIDKSEYFEIDIYAEVQVVEEQNKDGKMSELVVGDAVIFLPSKIDTSSLIGIYDVGIYDFSLYDFIEGFFRPQINDEIVENQVTYRIQRIVPQRVGADEIYLQCFCKRLDDTRGVGV